MCLSSKEKFQFFQFQHNPAPVKASLTIFFLTWILSQDGLKGPLAWAFQRDSEFVELFNYHFQKMDEGGLLSQLQKTIYNKETHDDKCNVQMITIGYENVAFPCLVLITGFVLALIYSVAEWQWMWMKKKLGNKSGKGGWLVE